MFNPWPMKIRLFTKPYCGWCHKALRRLDGQLHRPTQGVSNLSSSIESRDQDSYIQSAKPAIQMAASTLQPSPATVLFSITFQAFVSKLRFGSGLAILLSPFGHEARTA